MEDSVPLPWGTISTPSMIPSVEVPRKIHTREGKTMNEIHNIHQWDKASVLDAIGMAIDKAVEDGYFPAEDLDNWLDSREAHKMPDFVWYAVLAVVRGMEGIESARETED